MATYEEDYQRSLQDPNGFWGEAASDISWYKPWTTVLNDTNPPFLNGSREESSTPVTTASIDMLTKGGAIKMR